MLTPLMTNCPNGHPVSTGIYVDETSCIEISDGGTLETVCEAQLVPGTYGVTDGVVVKR